MHKRIPGIALAILCVVAGGMYAMRHGAGFFVPENAPEAVQDTVRAADLTQAFAAEAPERININTADEKELDKLPGIGPAKAAAILEYRKTHGFFRVPEDLMKVPGIKEGTYGKLADRVTVGELPEIGSAGGWPGILLPEAGEDGALARFRSGAASGEEAAPDRQGDAETAPEQEGGAP